MEVNSRFLFATLGPSGQAKKQGKEVPSLGMEKSCAFRRRITRRAGKVFEGSRMLGAFC